MKLNANSLYWRLWSKHPMLPPLFLMNNFCALFWYTLLGWLFLIPISVVGVGLLSLWVVGSIYQIVTFQMTPFSTAFLVIVAGCGTFWGTYHFSEWNRRRNWHKWYNAIKESGDEYWLEWLSYREPLEYPEYYSGLRHAYKMIKSNAKARMDEELFERDTGYSRLKTAVDKAMEFAQDCWHAFTRRACVSVEWVSHEKSSKGSSTNEPGTD